MLFKMPLILCQSLSLMNVRWKKSIDLKQKYVLQYPEKKNVYTIGYFNAIKWNQITEKITGKEE